MKKTLLIFGFLVSVKTLFSQESPKDSTRVNNLEEVVVTGQYNAQSVKKSVFQVKVISRKDIELQAGNNLADLLNQTLNINIVPNASTGKSGVQLFGLDSQYFKVLIDNIPVINDEGLGNNTDLTQINLDDIQQIEIVEGSMGVQYGADAVSGIINIITKKSSRYKWEIRPYIQEESVSNEYSWFNEGRHIQSIDIAHNISDKWYADALFTRNQFTGFSQDKAGPNHELNDGKRGYLWLPKDQFNTKALINYKGENTQVFYKFEYFNERVSRYDSVVRTNYNPSTQTTDPTASDEIFTSNRFVHHLNVNGKLDNSFGYDLSFSFQQQKRDVERYNYRIKSREKFDIENFEYESRNGFYSKGNFNNAPALKKFDYQLGYEISFIDGYASFFAGNYDGENIKKSLGSYDVFTSAEYKFNPKFSFRPGVRLLFSSQFKTQSAFSLSAKYLFENNFELRTVLGSAPRLPNYNELYTYFVDINHDVQGNENLNPEKGISAFIHANKTSRFGKNEDLLLSNKISLWYMDVSERIELIITNQTPLAYQYNNIDTYKTWGLSLTNGVKHKNLSVNTGISFSGISKVYNREDNLIDDDYLYALQLNTNFNYNFPKWNTVVSSYFKYNGPQYQFVQKQDDNGDTVISRGKQNAFSWWDASIKKSFAQKKFELTLGARNLLNVTTVNTTAISGGAHNGPASNIMLGYGRSYFLKFLYNLNI